MTRTRSEIGRSNRNRGAVAERAVVAWLRDNGFPHAERAVRTGYRTADRVSADHGDITGTPLLAWQVKDVVAFEEPARLAGHMADTQAQQAAAGAHFGLLVQRRRGTTDVGRWWVWLTGDAYLRLVISQHSIVAKMLPQLTDVLHPVRVALADVTRLLRLAGYGTPVTAPDNLPEIR